MPDFADIGPDKALDLLIECRSFSYKFPKVLSFLVQMAIKLSYDCMDNAEVVTKALTFGLLTSTQVNERLLKLKMMVLMCENMMKHDRVHAAHSALIVILNDLKDHDLNHDGDAQKENQDLLCSLLQIMVQIPDVHKIVGFEPTRVNQFEELLPLLNKVDDNIVNEEMKLKTRMTRHLETMIDGSSANEKWDLLDKESLQKIRSFFKT
ncbi:hypothetical protein Ciccas_000293 [Cichlidogyrus casuarinus]|uniref:Uncharacterized protein n=1 Tax=Cichlidogyrus casuarinus TaxID=1844966 RepID=A0ABD2QNB3_9PLAT